MTPTDPRPDPAAATYALGPLWRARPLLYLACRLFSDLREEQAVLLRCRAPLEAGLDVPPEVKNPRHAAAVGRVYLFAAPGGTHKVGYTCGPVDVRLEQVASQRRLPGLRAVATSRTALPAEVESALLQLYRPWCCGPGREWFRLPRGPVPSFGTAARFAARKALARRLDWLEGAVPALAAAFDGDRGPDDREWRRRYPQVDRVLRREEEWGRQAWRGITPDRWTKSLTVDDDTLEQYFAGCDRRPLP
jgi:hypothetical protein